MRFICLSILVVLAVANPLLSQPDDIYAVRNVLERREQICTQLRTEWYLVRHLPLPASTQDLSPLKRASPSTTRTTLTVSGWEDGFVCRGVWIARLLPREGGETPSGTPSQLQMQEEMVVLKSSPSAAIVSAPLYFVGQHPKEGIPFVRRLYLSGTCLDSGLMAAVLTGLNPLRLLAPDVQVKLMEAKVLLTGRLMPDITVGRYASPEVQIVLDPTKGYAPVTVRARKGDFSEEITVTDWKEFAGIWIPQTIRGSLSIYTLMKIRSECQLKSVEESSKSRPEWFKDRIVVKDVRLGEPGVLYILKKEGLPSIRVLEKMRREQNEREESAVLPFPVRSLPALLLITIGVLWYWRLRRAEGRKA